MQFEEAMSDETRKVKIHIGLFIAGLVDVEASPHPDGGTFLEGKVVVYDDHGNCFTMSAEELDTDQRNSVNLFAQELLCERAIQMLRKKMEEYKAQDVSAGSLLGGGNNGPASA